MTDFRPFSRLIHNQLASMSKHELFVVGEDSRAFEAHYLASFPPGTDPMYMERTEHDCNCCKNFIRNLGRVVAIVNDKIVSVWDIVGAEEPYATVAKQMAEFVRRQPITNLFRTSEKQFGKEKTLQMQTGGTVKNWNHFYGEVATKYQTDQANKISGEYRSKVQTSRRALTELSKEAIATVSDLIANNSLYRGEDHKSSVESFKKAHAEFAKLMTEHDRNLYCWANAATSTAGFFRNSAVGTLVQDLSNDVDLETAVKAFESKTAPTNYKRPTSLITPAMIKSAMKTIGELGLEPTLQRRFAKISDVTINNVLWVDNSVRGKMKDGIESLLMDSVKPQAVATGKAEEILIEDFMQTVAPNITSMSVLFKSGNMNNLMSLTAPVHENSGKLFKWNNDFGWSYSGNIADSIKEKVKRAGGNVTNAKLRASLAWFNMDDLDIHVIEPNRNRICYSNKCNKLDVDMNAGMGTTREAVENVSWTTVADGIYQVIVNQFCRRETTDIGCVVEVENAGRIIQLSFARALIGEVPICSIQMKNGLIEKITPAAGVVMGGVSQTKWGVATETFVKVETLMNSPNYWDDNAVGHRHWFFILEGCRSDEPTRGIYNEFLISSLDPHRKVFEVLGDKTKCIPSDEQLSGLGFSSARGDTVVVQVRGPKINKTFEIVF